VPATNVREDGVKALLLRPYKWKITNGNTTVVGILTALVFNGKWITQKEENELMCHKEKTNIPNRKRLLWFVYSSV
jgi:hypothetical protein